MPNAPAAAFRPQESHNPLEMVHEPQYHNSMSLAMVPVPDSHNSVAVPGPRRRSSSVQNSHAMSTGLPMPNAPAAAFRPQESYNPLEMVPGPQYHNSMSLAMVPVPDSHNSVVVPGPRRRSSSVPVQVESMPLRRATLEEQLAARLEDVQAQGGHSDDSESTMPLQVAPATFSDGFQAQPLIQEVPQYQQPNGSAHQRSATWQDAPRRASQASESSPSSRARAQTYGVTGLPMTNGPPTTFRSSISSEVPVGSTPKKRAFFGETSFETAASLPPETAATRTVRNSTHPASIEQPRPSAAALGSSTSPFSSGAQTAPAYDEERQAQRAADLSQRRTSQASQASTQSKKTAVSFTEINSEQLFEQQSSESEGGYSGCEQSEYWSNSRRSSVVDEDARRAAVNAEDSDSDTNGVADFTENLDVGGGGPHRNTFQSDPSGSSDATQASANERARIRSQSVPDADASLPPSISSQFTAKDVAKRQTLAAKALGVSKEAGRKTVMKAFRDGARTHHPDKGGDKDDFQVLNEAYTKLLASQAADRRRSAS